MALIPFQYIPNFQYDRGWDKYAIDYASLPQPNSVYDLTKTMMHRVVDKHFPNMTSMRVLDVNCGTGNDFEYFLNKGFQVVGTDGSAGMLNLASERFEEAVATGNVQLYQGKLEEWDNEVFGSEKFDLIYSVTGGFSYVSSDELIVLNHKLAELIKPHGKLIVANLNRTCWPESLYFGLRGKFKKAFRRKAELEVSIKGNSHQMYLRDKQELEHVYSEAFNIQEQLPLLACTPPYQTGYKPHKRILDWHKHLEELMQDGHIGTRIADQVITVASPKQK